MSTARPTGTPAVRGAARIESADGVATVILDRPPRNALTGPTADQVVAALRRCGADPGVRVVVLTGAGRYFSAGADLSAGPAALRDIIESDGCREPGYREPAARVTAAIAALPVPVVAAVNGDAVGGGATITLAADLRIAAEDARWGFPFTRLGVCPEGASTHYLPRLVGPGRAADWLLSGRLVDGPEALRSGLVTDLVPGEQVRSAALAWAREVAARTAPGAVAATRALLATRPATPEQAAGAESATIVELINRPDCAEGVAAFLGRRAPRFAEREEVYGPRDHPDEHRPPAAHAAEGP